MKTDTVTMMLTRTLKAPVADVWNAWSDGEWVKQWWGPRGFSAPVAAMDFKVGGRSLVCMRSPDGFEIYNTWSYTKIVPQERIEFFLNFSDKKGNKISPADLGMPSGIPDEVPHVITLKRVDNSTTEITIAEHGYPNEQAAEISRSGMIECLDKMEELLLKMKH